MMKTQSKKYLFFLFRIAGDLLSSDERDLGGLHGLAGRRAQPDADHLRKVAPEPTG